MIKLLLTIQLFFGFCASSQSLTDRFDSLINQAFKQDVFSGSILIAKNGKLVWQKSVGLADVESSIPNSAETKFQIGSITKLFTKTLVHQLIEKGKLKKTDKVNKFFTDFPSQLEVITIQQLLDHTSGLSSYYDVPGYQEAQSSVKSTTDILSIIRKEELQFKPGRQVAYSNSGYAVLAGIIERVTGKNYSVALKENILDRLEMKSTSYHIAKYNELGTAKGYLSNQAGKKRDNSFIIINGAGDGGIYSTTGDMLTFIKSLTSDNKLLQDKSKVDLFNSPLFSVNYSSWADFQKTGRLAIAGGDPGVNAIAAFNMETGNQVVVLSNYDEGSAAAVFNRLMSIMNNKPVMPFEVAPAKFIYELISAKGGSFFSKNYKAEFKKAGLAWGEDDMPLLYAGQALLEEHKLEDAFELYLVYTNEFPRIVVAWNDLGDIYLTKNDKQNASRCFEQALKIRPGNERAQQSLKKLTIK